MTEQDLVADRELRDSALRLFKSDLALVRADLRERGVGTRLAHRIGDSTMDMVDDAVDYAEANKGPLAALAAAVVVWFARGPIRDGLGKLFTDEEPSGPERLKDRLQAINPFSRE